MQKFLIGILCLVMIGTSTGVWAEIPQQFPINSAEYSKLREKVASEMPKVGDDCAKFVNRMFYLRFGKLLFGNAWELQLKKENQEFLTMKWRLDESDFIRNQSLALRKPEDRVEHFRRLYQAIDQERYPVGILGFVYFFSNWKDTVAQNKNVLPQTHVAFLAGRMDFSIKNDSNEVKVVEQLLKEKYGEIHDFERDFINEHIPLAQILQPGASITYHDYLVEEEFKSVISNSLLEVFLRKHRNNHITPLVRPVSFSRISDELVEEMKAQGNIEPPVSLTSKNSDWGKSPYIE